MPTSRGTPSARTSSARRTTTPCAPGRAPPPTTTSRSTAPSTRTPSGTTRRRRTRPRRSPTASPSGTASRSADLAAGAAARQFARGGRGVLVQLAGGRLVVGVVRGGRRHPQGLGDLVPAGTAAQRGAHADQLAVVCLARDHLAQGQQLEGLVGVQRGVEALHRVPVVLVVLVDDVQRRHATVAAAQEVQAGGCRRQGELGLQRLGSDAHATSLPRSRGGAKLPPRVTPTTGAGATQRACGRTIRTCGGPAPLAGCGPSVRDRGTSADAHGLLGQVGQ